MGFIVLDTDVASYLQRGTLKPTLSAQLVNNTICITFVTVGEFYKGAYLRNWGPARLASLAQWIQRVVIIPYHARVSEEWGKVSAEGMKKGRQIATNDAWIAACCRVHQVPLMTLNVRHFQDVASLTLIMP